MVDFETKLTEKKVLRKIVKGKDALDFLGIEYHESNITKKIDINLLKLDIKL
jgi:hypothetical protein